MTGLREILEAWEETAVRGEPAVLATVVKVAGSAYRRPGARMLFLASGRPRGFVSGGCLEGELADKAREVLRSGEPRTLVYDMRSPDDIVWGLGLGCNGEIRVLLERLDPRHPPGYVAFLSGCLDRREPGVLVTLFEAQQDGADRVGSRLAVGADGGVEGSFADPALQRSLVREARGALADARSRVARAGTGAGPVEAFVEYVAPPVSLLIFGAGSDARPLARMARALGWRVTVLDNREAYATGEHFPEADAVRLIEFEQLDRAGLEIDAWTVVLVMTHHFLHDLALLSKLLYTRAAYVGLLGPRQRTENLLRELESQGARPGAGELKKLYGPVGLDIGSETPEEIALSALAEIQAVLAGRRGGFLRDRQEALHDWPR